MEIALKVWRGGKGEQSYSWKGGRYINDGGYQMVANHTHPRKQPNGYIREHILIAEGLIGKELPDKAQIHHYGEKHDNSKMVICQDQEYHYLLHMRTDALNKGGNSKYRKCKFCQEWDSPENLHIGHSPPNGWNIHHQICEARYEKDRTKKRREKRNAIKTISGKSS